jgi:hypothetical protein
MKKKIPRFKPSLVISVHGIMTRARWQRPLRKILKDKGISYEPYNFGYYSVIKFLFQPFNDRMVDRQNPFLKRCSNNPCKTQYLWYTLVKYRYTI